MKKIIMAVCLFLFIEQADARFSRFVSVTPESEHQFDIKVLMEPVHNNPNKISIKFNGVKSGSKVVWLIVASSQISMEEQNFRTFIWSKPKSNRDILIKAQLSPSSKMGSRQKNITEKYYELEIDSKLINQSYVYIDFPTAVRDGGYYYTIDLAAYFKKVNNTANKQINKD